MSLISTGRAAKLAGVTRQTIQNYIHDGKLKATQTAGGHWRLEETHVRETLCQKPRFKLDEMLG